MNWDLDALLSRYLLEHVLQPDSERAYRQVVRRWIDDMRIRDIRQIDTDAVLHWRRMILDRARPSTWNTYRRHMRALIGFAIRKGLVSTNPFAEVTPAKQERDKKTVDHEVIEEAIRYLESDDCRIEPGWLWAMIVRALYYSGIRRRQLVGLDWGDVDLNKKIWRFRADTSKNRREMTLPIADPLLEDLKLLYAETTQALGHPPPSGHQVYCIPLFNKRFKSERLTRSQVSDFFKRLSQQLGVQIGPHRIRHTVATMLASNGNIRALQDLLGHVTALTTMEYVHPDVEQLRSLVMQLPPLGQQKQKEGRKPTKRRKKGGDREDQS